MLLVSQSGDAVNGPAKGAHRSATGQRQRRRRAVDANQAPSIAGQCVEIASVNEVNPTLEMQLPGVPFHELGPVEEPAVQRVLLDQQMAVGWRVGREALYCIESGTLHVGKRGMAPDLIIARKLERQQKVWLAFQLFQNRFCAAPPLLFAQEFPKPAKALDDDRAGAMRSIIGV